MLRLLVFVEKVSFFVMLNKLDGVETHFLEIEKKLSDPKIISDMNLYQKYSKEHAELSRVVIPFRAYKQVMQDLEDSTELLKDTDPEIKELAKNEVAVLTEQKVKLENEIKVLLLPKDPNDQKSIILEIRAGTGGDEASLFAGDLFRMYSKYAENRKWEIEILTHSGTGLGGFKEVIAMIHGNGAYSRLKFESGTHRVQRVPTTETQGRIHTSAVTVAVLPEAEEVELHIEPSDLKIDVFRATGPGGQSVNTTDSAVRITYLPTNLVVTCQDEKSQLKNKNKAMKVLRARLLDSMIKQQDEERSRERKSQIGSGDRSERIRTYNFPQGRVTDHRIGLTLYRLDSILEGNADEIIGELIAYYQAQALENAASADVGKT